MSSTELLAEIKRLPLYEQIALLEQIAHSLREEVVIGDESSQKVLILRQLIVCMRFFSTRVLH
jgi:hypothetical protein